MWLDVVRIVQGYAEKMVCETSGMKILLLDQETTGMLSTVVPQSFLLEHQVYLTDYLENEHRDKLGILKCIVFVRPTSSALEALVRELQSPRYSEYYLFFSSFLKNAYVERLAEADEYETVRQVQEVYLDYFALHANHVSLDLGPPIGAQINAWNPKMLVRTCEGVGALLLALRKRPLIRYDCGSLLASKLAQEMRDLMLREASLFDFRRPDTPPVLLLLDRRSDLISPLLMPWTYQAMVHELFGIHHGRVSIPKEYSDCDQSEHVLSVEQDPFFRQTFDSNFGDLGEAVQELVKSLQERTHQQQSQLGSLPAMKRFLQDYPDYRRHQATVAKHVALAGALSKKVEQGHLLQLSELEQTVACSTSSRQSLLHQLNEMLLRTDITPLLKLKLALIYALCSARQSSFNFLHYTDMLRRCEFTPEQISLVDFALKFSLANDLTEQQALSTRLDLMPARSRAAHFLAGKSVYTQYVPPLIDLLEQLVKGRLRLDQFPFVEDASHPERPQEIILFIIGGATYQEAHYVRQYNEKIPGISIILAGTCAPNSSRYTALSSVAFICSVIDDLSRIKEQLSSASSLASRK